MLQGCSKAAVPIAVNHHHLLLPHKQERFQPRWVCWSHNWRPETGKEGGSSIKESESRFLLEQTAVDPTRFLLMKQRLQQEPLTSAAELHTRVITVTDTWMSREEELSSGGSLQ